MRGAIEDLPTPFPLSRLVPGFLQEDPFLVRLLSGLDDVLAPVPAVLDSLEAYCDPLLAPADFVDWLAGWVGAVLDDNWSDELRRRAVSNATRLHRRRGTLAGLRQLLELVCDGDVEVTDHAGTSVSSGPTTAGESPRQELTITLRVDRPESIRLALLEELVASAKPAHLPHRIEVEQR